MVSRNDHLLVARKSMEAYRDAYESGVIPDSFELNEKTSDTDRKRIGFYFLILKNITSVDSDDDISEMIIDTEYVRNIHGEKNNDMGIDACYIDEEKNKINLFSFKYRENWNKNSQFKGNESYSSYRFLDVISGDVCLLDALRDGNESPYTVQMLEDIDKFRENHENVDINLYFVSNDVKPMDGREVFHIANTHLVSVRTVSLGDVSDILVEVKKNVSAKLKIPKENIMVYREEGLSSDTSYIFSIPLIDLARITSKNELMRTNLDEYDFSGLSDAECVEKFECIELESAVLHDNVRGDMGGTSYNKGIIETIANSPRRFFMFNNGVTITAEKVDNKSNTTMSSSGLDGSRGIKILTIELKNYQIVNGGQTLRSVHKFIKDNINGKDSKSGEQAMRSLRDSLVLVRAYSVGSSQDDHSTGGSHVYSIGSQIACFTNSQNAISPADLHSNDAIQLKLKKYLDDHEYEYALKREKGVGNKKNGKRVITKELMAQIIMAVIKKQPGQASNQKNKLFTEFYEDIFKDSVDFSEIKSAVDKYFMVMEYYADRRDENGKKLGKSIQRDLYTLYIMEKTGIDDISACEEILDRAFASFMTDANISKYRRLAYAKFKDAVDEQIASL